MLKIYDQSDVKYITNNSNLSHGFDRPATEHFLTLLGLRQFIQPLFYIMGLSMDYKSVSQPHVS